jgi:hypothetical protein
LFSVSLLNPLYSNKKIKISTATLLHWVASCLPTTQWTLHRPE